MNQKIFLKEIVKREGERVKNIRLKFFAKYRNEI